jgi:hypothetical protein
VTDQTEMWLPIETAPRDGTVIEIRNCFGVAPWYGLFVWDAPRREWRSAVDDRCGIIEGSYLTWRFYFSPVAEYSDPTGGFQNDPRYWREAVARKYRLPIDTFEPKPEKKSFLNRLKDRFK